MNWKEIFKWYGRAATLPFVLPMLAIVYLNELVEKMNR